GLNLMLGARERSCRDSQGRGDRGWAGRDGQRCVLPAGRPRRVGGWHRPVRSAAFVGLDPRGDAHDSPCDRGRAGVRAAGASVAAQLEVARGRGARLRLGERVQRWTASADGVAVTTDVDTYDAGQLLLCAGAWIGELFPDGREMFAVYRQLSYWFPIREGYP